MEPSSEDQFRFVEADIKDPKSLGWMLRYSPDAGSQHLRGILDELELQLIASLLSADDPDELTRLLVGIFNKLLNSPHLSNGSAFETVDTTHLPAHELARLNRQLLQHLYPDYVVHCVELEPATEDETVVGGHSVTIGPSHDVTVAIGKDINIIGGTTESLSEFELTVEEIQTALISFVPPVDYGALESQMESHKLIWIVGPSEAGKRTVALSLAHSKREFQSVYEIRGTRAWSAICESSVKDSVVLLTDALYLTGTSEEIDTSSADSDSLDEAEIDDEEEMDSSTEPEVSSPEVEPVKEFADIDEPESLHPIQRMLDQGNTIFITSPEALFTKARNDLKLAEVFSKHGCRFDLSNNSYRRAERLKLIRKAINLAHERELNVETKGWALRACDKLEREDQESNNHSIFKEWLPGEILSFVISILSSAKSADEIEVELKVSLNRRLHSWFMQLDDESMRCFVFARAIFPHLEENELQGKLKRIIETFRDTYHVNLMPLSVYGYGTTPYISDTRPFRFVNAHVLQAATDVVAEYYNEPFRQLCPLLEEWSAPPQLKSSTGSPSRSALSKTERDQLIRESAPVRDAIARMAGSVGRYDFSGIRELLDHWASHPLGRIGQAAGIALRQVLLSTGKFEQVIRVVEDWARRSSPDVGSFQKRSAADALWRLVAVGLQPPQIERSLKLLKHLAGDPNPYVRRTVAHAASQIAGSVQISKVRNLLEHLAADSRKEVATYMVLCLTASKVDRQELRSLVSEWLGSGNSDLHDAATLYLLTRWTRYEERILLYRVLTEHEIAFQECIAVAIKLALQQKSAVFTLPVLRRIIDDLANRDDEIASRRAVAALRELERAARVYHRDEGQNLVGGLVKKWESSEKSTVRLTACIYYFNSARTDAEKLAVLKERLDPFVLSDQVTQRLEAARRLNWVTPDDRLIVHQTMQDWLITGNENAIATVVFYWLVAANDSEPERLGYLAAILDNFPLAFERALSQAIEALPCDTITPVLRRLVINDRAMAQKQVLMALSRMAKQDCHNVYRLLEDWLIDDNTKVGASVVFYWLAAENYTEAERYESLKGILSAFPVTFAQGVRDAVRILGPDCITPQVSELLH
jgi:hypothetical protein